MRFENFYALIFRVILSPHQVPVRRSVVALSKKGFSDRAGEKKPESFQQIYIEEMKKERAAQEASTSGVGAADPVSGSASNNGEVAFESAMVRALRSVVYMQYWLISFGWAREWGFVTCGLEMCYAHTYPFTLPCIHRSVQSGSRRRRFGWIRRFVTWHWETVSPNKTRMFFLKCSF